MSALVLSNVIIYIISQYTIQNQYYNHSWHIIIIIILYTVMEVGYEQTVYTASEVAGYIELCVLQSNLNSLQAPFVLNVLSSNGTAGEFYAKNIVLLFLLC